MTKKHKILLCRESELSLDECQEKSFEWPNGIEQTVFFIRREHGIVCYLNNCPHTGSALNWSPQVFLDTDRNYIQCSLHGALFEKDSGYCVYGPCKGQNLGKIATILEDNSWYALPETDNSRNEDSD